MQKKNQPEDVRRIWFMVSGRIEFSFGLKKRIPVKITGTAISMGRDKPMWICIFLSAWI